LPCRSGTSEDHAAYKSLARIRVRISTDWYGFQDDRLEIFVFTPEIALQVAFE
jgi:hypothetical protein